MNKKILQTFKILLLLTAVMLTQLPSKNVDAANSTYTSGYWQYEKINSTQIRIVGYTGSATKVVVPSTIGSYAVVEIGDNVFNNNKNVTSIEISNGIKKIGQHFASYASNLNTLIIPPSVESTGIWFCAHTALSKVQLRYNGKLYTDSFYYNSQMKDMNEYPFYDTPYFRSDTTIVIGKCLIKFADTKSYSSYDLSSLRVTKIYPNSLNTIKTTTLIFPKNCYISSNAVNNNTNIRQIYIQANTTLESYFVHGSSKLLTLNINGCTLRNQCITNTSFSSVKALTLTKCSLSNSSIYNLASLSNLTLDSCTLASNCIFNCADLTTIKIRNIPNLTTYFIYQAPKLENVTIEGAKKIYNSIFRGTAYGDTLLKAERKRILEKSKVNEYLKGRSITSLKPIEKAHIAKLVREYCRTIWTYNSNRVGHVSLEAAMLDREAACLGFANAYQYILQAVGINSCILTGREHAWNYVQLNSDMWFHVDMTSAVQASGPMKSYTAGDRFMVSDSLRYQAEPDNTNPKIYWSHSSSKCSFHPNSGSSTFNNKTVYAMGDLTLTKNSSGQYTQIVNQADIDILQNYFNGKIKLTETQMVLADMNFDGDVNSADLVSLMIYVKSNELKKRTIY